ncbi:DUF1934 domain-containing protein [bacterium 1XD42-8]|jgi:uncharacterized beta-barrel protein YwiB (DUF1934 family)|nr:DUF1934 domain-containing protein [Lachnospiraceae bacterium]RKJ40834.1 DUF1934 domain-containing protein [bacterium 1XD42-8]
MTKDVLISVKGIQFGTMADDEPLEVISPGEYFKKNGKHYIIYEEVTEGYEGTTLNTYQFQDRSMELTKKGLVNVHMVFEEGRKNLTNYVTPYGTVFVGLKAHSVEVKEKEEEIKLEIQYDLEVNYEYLAHCNIYMSIVPRERKNFLLQKETKEKMDES